jgi:hypothetical protein
VTPRRVTFGRGIWGPYRRYFLAALGALLATLPSASFADDIKTAAQYVKACDVSVPSDECSNAYFAAITARRMVKHDVKANCLPSEIAGASAIDADGHLIKSKQPAYQDAFRAEVRATAQWLGKHPEFDNQGLTVSITAAVWALYPCK